MAFEETDARLHQIMVDIHANTVATAEEYGVAGDRGWREPGGLPARWPTRGLRWVSPDPIPVSNTPGVLAASGAANLMDLARSAAPTIPPRAPVRRESLVCGRALKICVLHHDGEHHHVDAADKLHLEAERRQRPRPVGRLSAAQAVTSTEPPPERSRRR